MDINTLIDSCAEAIANDAAVDTFCQAEYGRAVTVFLNFDERNPPGETDCPAVAIYPASKSYGGEQYRDGIEFACMIYDETAREHATIATIVEYAGVRNVESLRKKVLAALAAVVDATANTRIAAVDVDYDTISFFPFLLVACACRLETPYTIGSGNPITNE